jgi:hypothetical protein
VIHTRKPNRLKPIKPGPSTVANKIAIALILAGALVVIFAEDLCGDDLARDPAPEVEIVDPHNVLE